MRRSIVVTAPSGPVRISSYSALPMRLRDTAFDLPAALLGIHHHARVGGVHGLQDPHLAGRDVDRDAEPLHVERHRSRRAVVATAADQRPDVRRWPRWRPAGPGTPPAPRARRRPCPPTRTRRCRNPLHRCRIGAGAPGPTSTPSSDATIWACTVEVPLPNSAVPTDRVKSPSASSEIDASAKCPRGGMVAIIATAMPSPTRHCSPSGAGDPSPEASACCDEVEALVEAVAAVRQVVVGDVGVGERVAGDDDVATPEVERVDAELARPARPSPTRRRR